MAQEALSLLGTPSQSGIGPVTPSPFGSYGIHHPHSPSSHHTHHLRASAQQHGSPQHGCHQAGGNVLRAASHHRLRWTPELHSAFEASCAVLGGAAAATPKALQAQLATAHGVTISLAGLKSHLQAYRRKGGAHKVQQGSLPPAA